jgi:hypothetical protein
MTLMAAFSMSLICSGLTQSSMHRALPDSTEKPHCRSFRVLAVVPHGAAEPVEHECVLPALPKFGLVDIEGKSTSLRGQDLVGDRLPIEDARQEQEERSHFTRHH